MVKPIFVEEMRSHGKVVKEFQTEVLNNHICSRETLQQVRAMMEGVVENGTGKEPFQQSLPDCRQNRNGTGFPEQGGLYQSRFTRPPLWATSLLIIPNTPASWWSTLLPSTFITETWWQVPFSVRLPTGSM